MPSLRRRTIRLAIDLDRPTAPLVDLASGEVPALWLGSPLRIELGFFRRGAPVDVALVAIVRAYLKPIGLDLGAPGPEVLSLVQGSCSVPDYTMLLADWTAGTKQHATIEISGDDMAFALPPLGKAWLTITAETEDDPGESLTLAAAPIAVAQDGVQPVFGGEQLQDLDAEDIVDLDGTPINALPEGAVPLAAGEDFIDLDGDFVADLDGEPLTTV